MTEDSKELSEEEQEQPTQFTTRSILIVTAVICMLMAWVANNKLHYEKISRGRKAAEASGIDIPANGGSVHGVEFEYASTVESSISAEKLFELIEKHPALFHRITDLRFEDGEELTEEHFEALALMEELQVLHVEKGQGITAEDLAPLAEAESLESLYVEDSPATRAEMQQLMPEVLYSREFYSWPGGLKAWIEIHDGQSVEEAERELEKKRQKSR